LEVSPSYFRVSDGKIIVVDALPTP